MLVRMRTRARCLRCLMYRAAATAAAPTTAAAKMICLLSMPRTRSSGCSEVAILEGGLWRRKYDSNLFNQIARHTNQPAVVTCRLQTCKMPELPCTAQAMSAIEHHCQRPSNESPSTALCLLSPDIYHWHSKLQKSRQQAVYTRAEAAPLKHLKFCLILALKRWSAARAVVDRLAHRSWHRSKI